ncbi:type VI secretion system protein TssA [Niveibacterium umoris]|uniref:Type VI secretion system protein ImpA n=1 Tax=Niveibacterium umoris TaxID=1193620 RepID=A0A840BHE8_9RHOO|nr:type VI secretion system protein TssA [Niveibacterium umoris]MBB4011078.1 type VI secretion system protein ImpA [Niveibacterium umoris]
MNAPHAPADLLAALLAPLPGSNPTGEDLSFSPEFDALDEARREDDASLDQGDWVTTLKVADWRKVIDIATALLNARTKDLRVAARYAEASGRLNGVAGLEAGFRLVAGLLQAFPDTLHPLPEDSDSEERAGALAWLLQRALDVLKAAPLLQTETRSLCWDDYERARSGGNRSDDEHAQEHADLATAWDAATRTTPLTRLEATGQALNALADAIRTLDLISAGVLGDSAPSLRLLRDQHERIHHLINRLIAERGGLSAAASAQHPANDDAPAQSARAGTEHAGQRANRGMSREEAVAMLGQVAAYFRRTEPHSPVAYLAEKAATWANMPLHDWLRQVVKDDGALAHIDELLGVER